MSDLVFVVRGSEGRVRDGDTLTLEMPISVEAPSPDGKVYLSGYARITVRWEGGRLVVGDTPGPRVETEMAAIAP